MSIYFEIAKYSFLRFLTYPLELIADFVKRFFQVIFLVVFWVSVTGATESRSLNELLSYFIIVSVISDIVMAERLDLAVHMRTNIKSGQINTLMIRPLTILPAFYADVIGKRAVNLQFSLVAFVIALLIHPPQSLWGFIFFIILLIGGTICGIAINLILGSLSFFIVETHTIGTAIAQFLRLLSGVFVPLYYYPGAMRSILEKTFIPFLAFKPIDALSQSNVLANHLLDILLVFIWAVILMFIAMYMWSRGFKKYEAIGI